MFLWHCKNSKTLGFSSGVNVERVKGRLWGFQEKKKNNLTGYAGERVINSTGPCMQAYSKLPTQSYCDLMTQGLARRAEDR